MAKFSELSSVEIQNMPQKEFDAVSPFEKKSCYDCAHLFGKVTWWCGSQEALEVRGTRIPGVIRCSFWKPDWNQIDKQYKTADNGYLTNWQRFKHWLFDDKLPFYLPEKRGHTDKLHLAIWNCGLRPQSFWQAIKDTRITLRKNGAPIWVVKKGSL